MKFKYLLLFLTSLMFCATVQAAEPRLLQAYNDWDAYVLIENGNKICYMASRPKTQEGDYTKRGDVFALITHRPSEGTKNVFSYIAGYTYKPGSDAVIEIDSGKFPLFTQDDTAWAPDAETDDKLAQALKSGSSMKVRGSSSRETSTVDHFSLKGSSDAYERISKECAAR